MTSVDVDLAGTEPAAWFHALLLRLGGDWHLEAAGQAWRGERVVDGFRWEVGLERPEGRWIVAWRARPEVPDAWGLGLMLASLAAASLVLAVAQASGRLGPAALAGSVVTLGLGLGLGRRALAARLPRATASTERLGEAVRAAIATSGAEERVPVGATDAKRAR